VSTLIPRAAVRASRPSLARGWRFAAAGCLLAVLTLGATYAYADYYTWGLQSSSSFNTNWKSVAVSDNGEVIVAVRRDSQPRYSTNGGSSWNDASVSGYAGYVWQDVAIDGNGQKSYAVTQGDGVYYSAHVAGGSGYNMVPGLSFNLQATAVAVDQDASTVYVAQNFGNIYVSIDGGVNWSANGSSYDWRDVATSDNGQVALAVPNNHYPHFSTNSGDTWQVIGSVPLGGWGAAAISGDGTKMAAFRNASQAYISSNSGVTWVAVSLPSTINPSSAAMSGDGSKIVVVDHSGGAFVSADGGVTWETQDDNPNVTFRLWRGVAISESGARIAAVSSDSYIFTADAETDPPTVVSVDANFETLDGTYGYGSSVFIDVVFSEPIVVNGSPRILLETGATDEYAEYYELLGDDTIVFEYVVQNDDVSADLDCTFDHGVEPNGGTIEDLFGNSSTYPLPCEGVVGSLGANANIVIAGNQPPTVSLEEPDPGDFLSGTYAGFLATASDDVGVVGVTFWYDNGNGGGPQPIGLEDTMAPYGDSVSWDTTALSNGSVTVSAVARDGLGEYATSTVSVFIDNLAPTVALTSPLNGAYASGTATVSASASDSMSGVAGVQFLVDGVAYGDEDTSAPYEISWDTTALADGTHTLAAVARDAAGNEATSPAITVTVDNAPPTVLSASSSKAAGAYTVGEVIDIDIQFSEAVTSTGNVTVTLETGATDRTCTFSISAATYGTCNYTVQAGDTSSDLDVISVSGTVRDVAGNPLTNTTPASNLAANEALVIDTTAPSVSLTAPTSGATVSGAAAALAATASDGGAGLVGVQFKIDGAAEGAEDTSSPFGVTWDTTAVANGSHTLAAVARDVAGNYATSTVTVTVDNAVPEGNGGSGDSDNGGRRSSGYRVRNSASGSPATASGDRFTRDIDAGSTGGEVRRLQRFLNSYGFTVAESGPGSPGEETDFFGSATAAALRRFQASRGIPATGNLGPLTRAAIDAVLSGAALPEAPLPPAAPLGIFARDLEEGDLGDDVRALQAILIDRAAGPAAAALAANGATGYFGPLTRAALAELQAALGVAPAAGYFGPRTRAALGL
jgi:peptidoglycan hydrolase-like protein with peptidoglycan-binding domain